METAINISTARANRIAQKLAESKLSGEQQIRLRLECGLELDQLHTELSESGRVRDPKTRKTKSTFRWGEYCAEHFPGVSIRTISDYINLGLWSAVNSEISEKLIEQSDSWSEYSRLVGDWKIAQLEQSADPESIRYRQFKQQSAERAAETRARNRAANSISDSPSTGISYKTARRLDKLRGMCSDTGPEGETARARFEKLTGETAEQFFASGRATGLASCANSLEPELRRAFLDTIPSLAESLAGLATVNSLSREQLVWDFAATLLEHIESLPIEFRFD